MKIRSHTFWQSFMATPPEGSWIQKLSQKKCSVLVLVLQMGRGYFLWRSSCLHSRYLLFCHAWQLRYVSSQLRIGRACGRRTSDLLFSQRLSTIVLAILPSYCRWPIRHLRFGLEQSSKKLKVALLQVLCESLELQIPSPQGRRKAPYVALLQKLVNSCSCSAIMHQSIPAVPMPPPPPTVGLTTGH